MVRPPISLPPLRGQVWVCAFPAQIGPHPAVILTANAISRRLAGVTVVLIRGTPGPRGTHVPVGPESGLKKYAESYVDCTELHTVGKPRLRRPLGLLAQAELRAVELRVRDVLQLD
ncbi:type II toxin-antitoxin system PemK/MazF family toxin [Streptomyces johnsoniae]|uniref:Type II toxin-antitoxin system PemK/MazF family toxin n=1 Tax=Streptomyces johnsoniae TaxID=3075532 RepID=A0ABU2RYU8_9ACTN|nr:type II toxin-antitoxin system PemK/MazF family toxin [Streptomyces sp. DSM 41886]MDT0441938.1 type II toxin-antitoxin system PemK/MazF family toxin [Streptomyces sp. DSM 41886]